MFIYLETISAHMYLLRLYVTWLVDGTVQRLPLLSKEWTSQNCQTYTKGMGIANVLFELEQNVELSRFMLPSFLFLSSIEWSNSSVEWNGVVLNDVHLACASHFYPVVEILKWLPFLFQLFSLFAFTWKKCLFITILHKIPSILVLNIQCL